MTAAGAGICLTVVGNNMQDGVTWVHSYVTQDKNKTFCIYDAPTPEAIRRAAERNSLPVDTITEVKRARPVLLPLSRLIRLTLAKGDSHERQNRILLAWRPLSCSPSPWPP